jgi:hypothetical protein
VPKSVVRGIQCGLGLQLAILALTQYVPSEGNRGYVLAAIAFVVALLLLGNRVFPPAPLLIALGIAYAFAFKLNAGVLAHGIAFQLPRIHTPTASDILAGFLVLALPQLPLSLGNSILATRQIAEDLFPKRNITIRKISSTYSVMNLINPFFGGVPTCHGSGGMAGHYAFGGRTGGSIVIYGSIYLALGVRGTGADPADSRYGLFRGGFHRGRPGRADVRGPAVRLCNWPGGGNDRSPFVEGQIIRTGEVTASRRSALRCGRGNNARSCGRAGRSRAKAGVSQK